MVDSIGLAALDYSTDSKITEFPSQHDFISNGTIIFAK